MKKVKSTVRNKWVTVRMNESEYQLLEKYRKQTTEKTNSNYLRKLAFREPVTRLTRNQSLDELTAALIGIKKELYYIGHNFNQVVHKLHTLDRIPQFRTWATDHDATRKLLEEKTKKLILYAHQTLSQWSQK